MRAYIVSVRAYILCVRAYILAVRAFISWWREKERNLGTQLEHRPARFKTHWCVLYQAVVLYVHASRSVNCGGILPVGRSGFGTGPVKLFSLDKKFHSLLPPFAQVWQELLAECSVSTLRVLWTLSLSHLNDTFIRRGPRLRGSLS